MTTETMTVHKALCELKILDERIMKRMNELTFCKSNKHSNPKIDGKTLETWGANVKENYQSVTDMINRRKAIKKAIVLSNAVTKVVIDDVEYTVAEAIEMKNHGLSFEQILLRDMKQQYAKELAFIEIQNGDKLEQNANAYVMGLYGNKDMKNLSEDAETDKKKYIASNSFDLVDPLNCDQKIKELESKIDSFMAEVDSALSVSNAVTILEVSY